MEADGSALQGKSVALGEDDIFAEILGSGGRVVSRASRKDVLRFRTLAF